MNEHNKQIVNNAFDLAEQGNLEGFLNTLSDDFKWTTIGSTSVSGTYDIEGLLEDYFPKIAASFDNMPIIVPDQVIAEGDHVIRIGHGEGGIAKNGLEYNNIYCFVIHVIDGKIKKITEFCDTDLVQKAQLGQY
jgi:hypothetical protein